MGADGPVGLGNLSERGPDHPARDYLSSVPLCVVLTTRVYEMLHFYIERQTNRDRDRRIGAEAEGDLLRASHKLTWEDVGGTRRNSAQVQYDVQEHYSCLRGIRPPHMTWWVFVQDSNYSLVL